MSKESEKLIEALSYYLDVRDEWGEYDLTPWSKVEEAKKLLAEELDRFHSFAPILLIPEELEVPE